MKDLTLIIPAKNESESLPIFLGEIQQLDCKKKIILDKNDKKTLDSISHMKDIEIFFQQKKGFGSALIEGINDTDTEFFCIMNADGSMDPKYLNQMFENIKVKELDFIFATRYEKPGGGSDDDTLITLIGNYIFTKIGNIFFSLNLSDILFTYVMGRTKSFNNLEVISSDFTFCVELPIKVKKQNMKYGTLPSHERVRIAGAKKVNALKDGFLILVKMVKLFFKL